MKTPYAKSRIVKGNGEILEAYFPNSFRPAEGIAALREEGLEVISAMELAEARTAIKDIPPVIEEIVSSFGFGSVYKRRGPGSLILTGQILLAENFNYMLNGDILVASREYNPILKSLEKATAMHKHGKEFYLDEQTVDELMAHAETNPEKAIKSGVLRIPGWKPKLGDNYFMEMLTMYLGESLLAQFLFKEFAGPYGRFLNSIGAISIHVRAMPAHDKEKADKVERYIKMRPSCSIACRSGYQEKPFARPLVMGHIDDPLLDGDNEDEDTDRGYHCIDYGTICGIRRLQALEQHRKD